jgi:hypothetical protein
MAKNWFALSRTFTFEIWKKKKLDKLFDSQKFPKKIIETRVSLIFKWFFFLETKGYFLKIKQAT